MPLQLVENIMTEEVISVPADIPIKNTLLLLSENKISFVVVSDGVKPIGIITERDIVRFTVEYQDDSVLTAKDVMSTPVFVSKGGEIDIAEAYHRLKLQQKRHLVIVGDTGNIRGVVTLTDFIKHLGVEAFIEHKPLSHILTASPVTVKPETTAIDAIQLMVKNKISCMIVADKGKPVGILTERDVARIRSTDTFDLSSTPMSDLMTQPVITVPPTMNTADASNMMRDHKVRHLIIVDKQGLIVGVVTETNIVQGMEGRYVQSLVELLDEKDAQLRAVNESLERRVRQRTEELSEEVEAHRVSLAAMRKLTVALQQAGEAVVITDISGQIEYVNEAFVKATGYSWPEVKGKNPSILQSGRQEVGFYEQMWQSIAQQGSWKGVVWNKRKNGEIFPEQLHIRSIRSDEGEVLNYVGTFSDITEKMALEEEHRHTQRMKAIGSLVGGVAHNFNNILAGMVGRLYMAKIKAKSLPEVVKYLKSVEALSEQAADMVRQLLTFARKEVTERHNVPVIPLMKEALETSRLGIPEDIEVLADFSDEEDLAVYGDASQLQQVLMNIVNNAKDAMTNEMPRSIAVSLKSFVADEYLLNKYPQLSDHKLLCLTIKDSGSGISKSDLKHIFEPFFSTKEVGKGTGLGLSMAKGSIESHGGAIEVDSTVGKGTVFRIYLPLAADEASELPEEVYETHPGHGELILLVDDEKIVIESAKDVLESFGYRVITANNGSNAFEIFMARKEEIALMITDIVMPKLGGYELARRVRQHSQLPIVFLTGYDYEQKNDSNDLATAIIPKPFNVQKLSAILAGFLQK